MSPWFWWRVWRILFGLVVLTLGIVGFWFHQISPTGYFLVAQGLFLFGGIGALLYACRAYPLPPTVKR